MNKNSATSQHRPAFTLAEVLAALTISTMVMVALLGIYSRAEKSAAAITKQLDKHRLPAEVLQRIAEDVDRIISHGPDTRITLENRLQLGYPGARLIIERTIYGKKDERKSFEKIIWQSTYDFDSDVNGLVLYRSHTGIAPEDKLLDEKRRDWEKAYSFVPICSGVTLFSIEVIIGEKRQNKWTTASLPRGIAITISFAEPFKTITGDIEVPEEEKITRTIAIDRTRKLKFIFVPSQDPNQEEAGQGYGQEDEGRQGGKAPDNQPRSKENDDRTKN